MPSWVIDVGAHKGEDSDYYLAAGHNVVAVEANPRLIAFLESRFEEAIKNGRFRIHPYAISRTPGKTKFFFYDDKTVWGTINTDWKDRNQQITEKLMSEVSVETSLLEAVPHLRDASYIKIDIEGSDLECLKELRILNVRPEFLSFESSQMNLATIHGELLELKLMGYKTFKVVGQRRHKSCKFTFDPETNRPYKFSKESSGPFGVLIDSKWINWRKARLFLFLGYLAQVAIGPTSRLNRKFGNFKVIRWIAKIPNWYDIHASLYER
jgi:FkbM family methyltransferase